MELQIFSNKNVLMEKCLQEIEIDAESNSSIQNEIARRCNIQLDSFVIHQGCYLLASALPEGYIAKPEEEFVADQFFEDRTGYECFENHIHTNDLLNNNEKGWHHLLTGITLAAELRNNLRAAFPQDKFRIIISFPVIPFPTPEELTENDCTIRFHAKREGEIIYDDLEDFRFEAMGIIEVG